MLVGFTLERVHAREHACIARKTAGLSEGSQQPTRNVKPADEIL